MLSVEHEMAKIPKTKMPKPPQRPMAGYTSSLAGLMRGGPGIAPPSSAGSSGPLRPSFRNRMAFGADQSSYPQGSAAFPQNGTAFS